DFAHFENGLCAVTNDNLIGMIDASGAVIIPCEIDKILDKSGDILKFEKNSKIAYYNTLSRQYIWKEEGY
ncbi:MAG: hypothetical protein ACXVDW_18965, partial [Bacteroidia bacterium]